MQAVGAAGFGAVAAMVNILIKANGPFFTINHLLILGVCSFGAVMLWYIFCRLRPKKVPDSPALQQIPQRQFPPSADFHGQVPRPNEMVFHVLKAFDRIHPTTGALTVEGVAAYCGIRHSDALTSVKQLWEDRFIYTAIPGPGEWNGHYKITPLGRSCVRLYAT